MQQYRDAITGINARSIAIKGAFVFGLLWKNQDIYFFRRGKYEKSYPEDIF